ncbi:hypothetical protein KO507_05915 [Gilvimarinus agarilyticus]|nr:hypothetical protein [Gilvimarinus agarilyticus]
MPATYKNPLFKTLGEFSLFTRRISRLQLQRLLLGKEWIISLVILLMASPVQADYYQPSAVGSDALYTPLNSFSHYTFDTLQLPRNFDQHNLDDRFQTLFDNLSEPGRSIDNEGGWGRFINRQVLPYDTEYVSDWPTMLPNYALHLFGGGLVYRRDLEYFRAKDYSYPQLAAVGTAILSELAQEAVEKKTTTEDDPVADFYIFRPLGLWLFADDGRAKTIEKWLKPAIWPHQLMYNPSTDKLRNAGISYVIRPQLLSSDNTELFMYMGMNNMAGLSHTLSNGQTISWGVGVAMTRIYYKNDELAYNTRPSAGIFADRNGNLLWSAIYNGTEDLKLRVNIYPWQRQSFKFGIALGITDDQHGWFGATLNMPFGIAGNF